VIDLYKTLGLEYGANLKDIFNRFAELSEKYHPEFNHSSKARQRFIDINISYYILEYEEFKKDYDKLYRSKLLNEDIKINIEEQERELHELLEEARSQTSKYLNMSYKKFYRKIPKHQRSGIFTDILDFFSNILPNI